MKTKIFLLDKQELWIKKMFGEQLALNPFWPQRLLPYSEVKQGDIDWGYSTNGQAGEDINIWDYSLDFEWKTNSNNSISSDNNELLKTTVKMIDSNNIVWIGTDGGLVFKGWNRSFRLESLRLGLPISPITNIYLGKGLLKNDKNVGYKDLIKLFPSKKFVIKNNFNHKKLSVLLSKNKVIAIVRGKEEFGARALGNRSIIANPSQYEVVKKINESIKNRDFWMPFALTILKEKHRKFIKNSKNFRSDFMTMTFDTVEKNVSHISAGCHPYDKTVRPQILEKKFNPQYYSLIKEFNKITNIPALLNTSLNLHGNPVASSLQDVVYTFKNSGLKYLYIDDKFLITKIF